MAADSCSDGRQCSHYCAAQMQWQKRRDRGRLNPMSDEVLQGIYDEVGSSCNRQGVLSANALPLLRGHTANCTL